MLFTQDGVKRHVTLMPNWFSQVNDIQWMITVNLNVLSHYLISMSLIFSLLKGFAGGSYHTNSGGAVDPLCLPRDPELGMYRDGTDGYKSYMYGAEYQTHKFNDYLSSFHNHDVPCAVCLTRNRSVVKMFPGNARNKTYLIYHKFTFPMFLLRIYSSILRLYHKAN